MARSALLQATSFAHLIGLGRQPVAPPAPARAAENDDDDDQREGESDEDYEKRKKRREDAKAAATALAAANSAAEDDDKQREGESDEDFEKRKAKKAKKARDAGDDDTDEEDETDASASVFRHRERARCAAIFAAPAAAKRPDMAAYLAFGTNLPRTAAINTLKAVAAGERSEVRELVAGTVVRPPRDPAVDLRSRMALQPAYEVGSDPEHQALKGPDLFAAKMLAADKKRRGEK
jgi:hypothetical protein